MKKIIPMKHIVPILLAMLPVMVQAQSPLASGTWFKLAIPQSGLYAVTTAQIPSLQGVPVSRIALYGSTGEALPEVNNFSPLSNFRPLSVKIEDQNQNSVFDAGDKVIFYAEGIDTWKYTNGELRHSRHPYDSVNYLFLTLDAENAPRVEEGEPHSWDASTSVVSTYMARSLHHLDKENTHGSGRIWVGERLSTSATTLEVPLSLPSSPVDGMVEVRYALASVSSGTSNFRVSCGSTTRTHYFYPANPYNVYSDLWPSTSATNTVRIEYSASGSQSFGYLDYVELKAKLNLAFSGSQFTFYAPADTTGWNQYQLYATASNLKVWDITDIHHVKQLPAVKEGNSLVFSAENSIPRRFVVYNGEGYLSPLWATRVSNQDLSGAAPPDMVIVANPMFLSQARRLATLHEVVENLRVIVCTDQQCYNEFSSGKQDPMAIRQMMRHLRNRHLLNPATTSNPRYLLLFGKGSFDYKNILQSNLPTVVTYQTYESFENEGNGSFASDDYFGYLDTLESHQGNGDLDLGIGRLPAKNAREADHMVNKIEKYMLKTDLQEGNIRGDWRNSLILLADDADPSCPNDSVFASSSEYTAQRINELYPQYNISKIFADAYRQQSGAIGSYYPDVNNALVQKLNYGALLFNYVGHGSERYIGTERYMELSDISNYTNTLQLPFFVASTCSFGKYDMIDKECGSEALLLANGAGIGTLAASRPISHSKVFNTQVCVQLLNPANAIGDAVRISKNYYSTSPSITLMGDPALRLSLPSHKVVVTAINGKEVEESVPDTALVLSKVSVEGEIRDGEGNLQEDFNGLIFPVVYDRIVRTSTLANDNEGTEVNFTQQKNILFKGVDSVVNGRFSYTFIVPRDVAYQFDFGRLSHYAKSATNDATGSYGNILFGGIDPDVDLSETRPEISLYMNDSTFLSGGITDKSPTLFAVLKDKVGINAAGSGLGHDITAILDNNPNNVIILNDFYQSDIQDPQKGYVLYQFQNLAPGMHSLTFKAWNIYNYSNSETIFFRVAREGEKEEDLRLVTYPSPASEWITLHVESSSTDSISSVVIGVFDMQGRKVKEFNPPVQEHSYVGADIHWDLTNEVGKKLSNGVYVVRAIITTLAGEQKCVVGKVLKMKP